MQTIQSGKFKTHCLSLLDEVSKKKNTIIVTKYGKPVAQLIPFSNSNEVIENPLKGSIVFEEDIVEPISEKWEAEQ